MIINKLVVEKDFVDIFENKPFVFDFGNKNLISSDVNSVGKTTLIRFLLFSLGFIIPSTKGMNMNTYVTKLYFSNSQGSFLIKRTNDRAIIFNESGEQIVNTYFLLDKKQLISMRKFIFEISNDVLADNLLGCFYIEQDQGWETANRGKILNSNSFSLEEIVEGLSNSEIAFLDSQIQKLRHEQGKYKALLELMRKTDNEMNDFNQANYNVDNETIKLREKQSNLIAKQSELKRMIADIETIISDNEKIGELLEKYNILVTGLDGQQFVLRKQNITPIGLNNSILNAKLNDYNSELNITNKLLKEITNQLNDKPVTISVAAISDDAVRSLKEANIDKNKLSIIVSDLGKDIAKYVSQKKELVRTYKNLYSHLIASIQNKLHSLKIHSLDNEDLVKCNLKHRFSGVELNNICLMFRLGLIDFLKTEFDINLPLIIDSPGIGERINVDSNKMIGDLIKNYQGNQVFVSTTEKIGKDVLSAFDLEIKAEGLIFEYKYKIIRR